MAESGGFDEDVPGRLVDFRTAGKCWLIRVSSLCVVFPTYRCPHRHSKRYITLDLLWAGMMSLTQGGNTGLDVKHMRTSQVRNTGCTVRLIFFSKFPEAELPIHGSLKKTGQRFGPMSRALGCNVALITLSTVNVGYPFVASMSLIRWISGSSQHGEQIFVARLTRHFIRLILCCFELNESHLMYWPVNVGFLYTEVLNTVVLLFC